MSPTMDDNKMPTTAAPGRDRPAAPAIPAHELPTWKTGKEPGEDTGSLTGRVFGDYELHDELGRGGMGVVYKAHQRGLNRMIALKMILPGPLSDEEDLQRFRNEAKAAASLQHPNIVAVHDVGEVDGQHFYSMDFIDGPSLAKRLSSGCLPGQVAARYVMIIARAIHYAHRQNILHRDLKPSNILLDSDDEPHITDFGLAKMLGGDSGRTRTGAVMGTPSYMSPEQAAGKTRELGPACDIYGLGAILYELITGKPLFRAETPLDTLKQVIELEPVPPREINPAVERDLETICLKCIQKDPCARYETADALADDLQRYLNGEPITARSFSVMDRLARTLDRSHHVSEFRGWDSTLLWFALILFLGHLAMFYVLQTKQSRTLHWLTRGTQFILMGLAFGRSRSRTWLPTSLAERQLWAIWIGYLLAYAIMVWVIRELAGEQDWDEYTIYPFSAALAGMAFFAMGSSYWGRCYIIGMSFFILAALMPFHLEWSPLNLGLLWSASLLVIRQHMRQIGLEPEEPPTESLKP